MKIKIRTLQNNEEEITVDKNETIVDVKKKIELLFHELSYDRLKLIYNGQILKDESKVVDVLNENGIVVAMAIRKTFAKNNVSDYKNTTSFNEVKDNNKSDNDKCDALKMDINKREDKTVAASDNKEIAASDNKEIAASDNKEITASDNKEITANDNKAVTANDNKTVTADDSKTVTVNDNKTVTADDTTKSKHFEDMQSVESTLLTGEQLKETINNICSMGFEIENVKKALRLAYNNPTRAIDYLTNGFPNISENLYEESYNNNINVNNVYNDNLLNEMLNSSNATNNNIFQNPQLLNSLRNLTLSNPQRIPEIIQMLERTDPSFLEYIREHQDEFIRYIYNYRNNNNNSNNMQIDQLNESLNTQTDQSNDSLNRQTDQVRNETTIDENYNIPITSLNETELESIKKLESLGFPKHVVLEAFIACDKNEEMAANYLFENMNDYFSNLEDN